MLHLRCTADLLFLTLVWQTHTQDASPTSPLSAHNLLPSLCGIAPSSLIMLIHLLAPVGILLHLLLLLQQG